MSVWLMRLLGAQACVVDEEKILFNKYITMH